VLLGARISGKREIMRGAVDCPPSPRVALDASELLDYPQRVRGHPLVGPVREAAGAISAKLRSQRFRTTWTGPASNARKLTSPSNRRNDSLSAGLLHRHVDRGSSRPPALCIAVRSESSNDASGSPRRNASSR
jgi:hypothetical protein